MTDNTEKERSPYEVKIDARVYHDRIEIIQQGPFETMREVINMREKIKDAAVRQWLIQDGWTHSGRFVPGAVHKPSGHQWNDDRCELCGEKDWYADRFCSGNPDVSVERAAWLKNKAAQEQSVRGESTIAQAPEKTAGTPKPPAGPGPRDPRGFSPGNPPKASTNKIG